MLKQLEYLLILRSQLLTRLLILRPQQLTRLLILRPQLLPQPRDLMQQPSAALLPLMHRSHILGLTSDPSTLRESTGTSALLRR